MHLISCIYILYLYIVFVLHSFLPFFLPSLHPSFHVFRRVIVSFDISTATWHQYDDAVFSQPSFWDSIRSLFPKWKVSDAAEGRRLAMMAMFPKWGEISEKEGTNGHATLNKINNVLHCMSRAEFENGGNFYPRIPDGFSATEVRTF